MFREVFFLIFCNDFLILVHVFEWRSVVTIYSYPWHLFKEINLSNNIKAKMIYIEIWRSVYVLNTLDFRNINKNSNKYINRLTPSIICGQKERKICTADLTNCWAVCYLMTFPPVQFHLKFYSFRKIFPIKSWPVVKVAERPPCTSHWTSGVSRR